LSNLLTYFARPRLARAQALDEEVARAHLKSLNVELTTMTSVQAEYLGLAEEGPYKASIVLVVVVTVFVWE